MPISVDVESLVESDAARAMAIEAVRGDRKLAGTNPTVSLLVTTVGGLVYVLAIVSRVNTVRRPQKPTRLTTEGPSRHALSCSSRPRASCLRMSRSGSATTAAP
jgi:hypothetical protein